MKKTLEENERAMKEMQQSYEEKLAQSKASVTKIIICLIYLFKILNQQSGNSDRSQILEKAKKVPHLTNINMDPSLSGTIKLLLEGEGQKSIGLPGSDIALNGIG